MHSEFRYTRHGRQPTYDVTVRLAAEVATRFSIEFEPELHRAHAPSVLHAVALGLNAAYSAVQSQEAIAITIMHIIDHSGVTGQLGFKICGEAAMYHLLGFPERAPFPGHVLDETWAFAQAGSHRGIGHIPTVRLRASASRSRSRLESSMDHSNPYTPPASRVASRRSGLAGSTRILLMCLISAQLAVALLSLPGGLQLVQHGDISPPAFLGAALATVALALGGALVAARRRPVIILFVAVALGMLTAIRWHPPFVFTCIAIGSVSVLIVLRAGRSSRTTS